MNTKSIIQRERERVETLSWFRSSLKALNEAYEVEEAVFGFNGKPCEVLSGYLEVTDEYNSIDEALAHYNNVEQGVYVVNPEQVLIGVLKPVLSECQGDTIIDIASLEKVEL